MIRCFDLKVDSFVQIPRLSSLVPDRFRDKTFPVSVTPAVPIAPDQTLATLIGEANAL
jgi:hypothetical protein